MPAPRITEEKGQPTWVDAGLKDLRTLEREYRSSVVEEIPHAATHEEAIEVVAHYLGFTDAAAVSLFVETPLGKVLIRRDSIYHIVEKRQDARERYVGMALDTLTGPFEVWKVAFTNDTHRLAYIGAYETKRQMLVSVTMENGRMLWNFMHTDAKSLNKHRHGELLYQRHSEIS